MYPVISKEDFGAYKEYSVIHTDRSLNLMSDPFQRVMRDLNELLKVTYNCEKVAIIPGMYRYARPRGLYAVKCLVIRPCDSLHYFVLLCGKDREHMAWKQWLVSLRRTST